MKNGNDEKNNIYSFGYNKFGPFLFGFTSWLIECISKENYQKVFFFSRDGFMMKKAFDILYKGDIESEYVYFSRKSIRQSLLWRINTYEESLKYLGWERYISVGKLLEYYGFCYDERIEICESIGLDLNRDIAFDDIKSDKDMSLFFYRYIDTIHYKSRNQSKLLLRYLYQIGMNKKCAIVDIGWHGSMQFYLEQFLDDNLVDAELDGYYVGVLPNVPLRYKARGFVYDSENDKARKKTLCFFGGFERLFQSFEGSTDGYIEDDKGYIEPLFAKYEYSNSEDNILIDRIKNWQQGALDFILQTSNTQNVLIHEQLIKPLIHFGMFPTLETAQVFTGFSTFEE